MDYTYLKTKFKMENFFGFAHCLIKKFRTGLHYYIENKEEECANYRKFSQATILDNFNH